jgi:hypothetical protein
MLLLGFLEHLLGLLDLQLVGLYVIIQQDSVLGPSSLQEILERPSELHNSLTKHPHCTFSPFCLMMQTTATMCARYLLVFPLE